MVKYSFIKARTRAEAEKKARKRLITDPFPRRHKLKRIIKPRKELAEKGYYTAEYVLKR